MNMNESEFNERVDDLLLAIEEALEAGGTDIDYENVAGILTLVFENDTKIIVNRQTPVQQIWVAAKSGGFHFDYDAAADVWRRDRDGAELVAELSRLCSEQAGEHVELRME